MKNPFEPTTEPVHHVVARSLLTGDTQYWDNLKRAAGGTLSTRTLGAVIRGLEAQGYRFLKFRDENGVGYELDPDGNAPQLTKLGGWDASHSRIVPVRTTPKVRAKRPPGRRATLNVGGNNIQVRVVGTFVVIRDSSGEIGRIRAA